MNEKVKIIKPFEGFQEQFVSSNVDLAIGGGSMGGGKLNPLYTSVLTSDGWKKMGDLVVGDMVCTPFGQPAKVLQIFEHKDKDIYEVETFDGRKCRCGLEHLWSFRTKKQIFKYRKHFNPSLNLTTEDTESIIRRIDDGQEIFIPIPKAQQFSEKELTIPPYILGVLIGDGLLTQRYSKTNFSISNTEEDIIDKVAMLSNTERVYRNPKNFIKVFFSPYAQIYNDYLAEISLNTYSYNKFIPKEYLDSSIEQRIQLLHGLMDTDGNIERNGCFRYCTTSKQLADDFVYLCRSLGYIATVSLDKREDKYTNGIAYNITIRTHDIIFSSQKHHKRWGESNEIIRAYKRTTDHVRIKSITKVDKCDARCIWIDDPLHLYIIDDFIATHNTAAAVMSIAEPCLDSKFRAVFLRNNLGDLRSGGGILDEFKKMYGNWCNVVESGEPHVDFPSGARIDVTHIADQSKEKVLQRFKGRQYDMIYFDEGTGFTWDCFRAVYSRNRGVAKWTGKVRMTTNPKRNHWLRTFLDWYIGIDGYIMPERNGVVRYFYINGETVNDVVWGDTKEEVYAQCRISIDRTLARFNGKIGTSTYKDIIKSFTFYEGKMASNKAILGQNGGYVGSVAVMGGRESQANLEGNWNVDTDEDLDAVIRNQDAEQLFLNEPCRNGDKWVTCDLADNGTDNFLCLAWDGFHIFDYLIVKHSTPRQNADFLHDFAAQHDIGDSHIIYDAVRGTYINDYIPDAIPFMSNYAPRGMYGRGMFNLKTECYMRLVKAINGQYMSIDENLGMRMYDHQNIKQPITIKEEFREECSVVRFKDMPSGKKCLMSKREMNAKLGKNRSMDLLDPCAMRFYPCLEYAYGEELEKTVNLYSDTDDDDDGHTSIYDETIYG